MKIATCLAPLAPLVAAAYVLTGCNADQEKHGDHDHDHDHSGEHADHDDGHDDHHGHDHDTKVAGPNGGRVIMSVEPHLEFLVTEDRKVRITALDPDNKTTTAMGDQRIRVISGDRTSPTRLSFTQDATGLISDGTLPEGNDFPVVVQISPGGDTKTVMEKFNLNLKDCPTCEFKEYACICDHGDEHDHGDHDHADDNKKS